LPAFQTYRVSLDSLPEAGNDETYSQPARIETGIRAFQQAAFPYCKQDSGILDGYQENYQKCQLHFAGNGFSIYR
jgi:hypothetical protein